MGPFFDLLSHPTRPLPRKTGLGPSIKCFEASLNVSDQSRGLEGSFSRFSVFHLCIWFWNMQQNTSNSEGARAQKIKMSRISSIFLQSPFNALTTCQVLRGVRFSLVSKLLYRNKRYRLSLLLGESDWNLTPLGNLLKKFDPPRKSFGFSKNRFFEKNIRGDPSVFKNFRRLRRRKTFDPPRKSFEKIWPP